MDLVQGSQEFRKVQDVVSQELKSKVSQYHEELRQDWDEVEQLTKLLTEIDDADYTVHWDGGDYSELEQMCLSADASWVPHGVPSQDCRTDGEILALLE